MWFWFSILTLILWSFSDLLGKTGCRDAGDRFSYLKMIAAVGIVMGLHAVYEIAIQGVALDLSVIIAYLPVSLLYIISMLFSYMAFRYIELSISSPICNSSGAIVAILTFIRSEFILPPVQLLAVVLICAGTIALGFVEANEDEELRRLRQAPSNFRYAKSKLAILLPLLYCLLDALGTFADSVVLESLDEDSANCAYELTFFALGLLCLIYVFVIKKERLNKKLDLLKLGGGCFETAGQFFYIKALADSDHVSLSAPIMASFCIASVLWSRLLLKERLSKKHYLAIIPVVLGIIILGCF